MGGSFAPKAASAAREGAECELSCAPLPLFTPAARVTGASERYQRAERAEGAKSDTFSLGRMLPCAAGAISDTFQSLRERPHAPRHRAISDTFQSFQSLGTYKCGGRRSGGVILTQAGSRACK